MAAFTITETTMLRSKYTGNVLAQCDLTKPNCDVKSDNLIILLQLLCSLLSSLFEILYDNYKMLTAAVIIAFFWYKVYWSPWIYAKDLTEVSDEHNSKGPYRALMLARNQHARRLGPKLPPPYPNGWFAVAESRDLHVGHVKTADFLGQNLCVYRGEDGKAYCVDAYCPHLGANLSVGGSVCGNCIECPFHKWRFQSSGECVKVPGQDKPPKGMSIKTWLTVEADGAVWIWHDADGASPRWSLKNAPEIPRWSYRGRNEFVVNSHIQDIPENSAVATHLNAVHSPSLISSLGKKHPDFVKVIGQQNWTPDWRTGEENEKKHIALMRLTYDYKFKDFSLIQADVTVSQIGPGHARLHVSTALGPMLILQSVTPISTLEQRVVHRIFSPTYNAPLANVFIRAESFMFERDVALWSKKRFVSSPAYLKMDKAIQAFRTWYSQFYSDSSISFTDAWRKQNNPLEW